MLTDSQKHTLVETVKHLTNPSELEKDILDTIEETSKYTFDMNHALLRINTTYGKYLDLYAKVNALPTTAQKPSMQIQESDLRYILRMQLDFLLEKEWEEKYRGQAKNGNP